MAADLVVKYSRLVSPSGILDVGVAVKDGVIVDMKRRVRISDDTQITVCGWTPYDNMTVQGWPTASVIRGNVVMEDDRCCQRRGRVGS